MNPGNFKVRYLKNTKQITLLRNLLAALVYESRGINLEDCLVLYDLLPQMLEKSKKDPQFANKHYNSLIKSYNLIRDFVNPTKFPYKPKKNVVSELKSNLVGWLPSKEAYFGWSKNPARTKSFDILPDGLNLKLPKLIKNQKYIGVGYKDKGSARNIAFDNSPGWKVTSRNASKFEKWLEDDHSAAINFYLDQVGQRREFLRSVIDDWEKIQINI
jgi:hypothetical protein